MSSSLIDRLFESWDWYRPQWGEDSPKCAICGKLTPRSQISKQRGLEVCPHCIEEPSWTVDEEDKIEG